MMYMYDDRYRQRFVSVPAAIHSEAYTHSDGEDIPFTHIHNHKDFEILIIKSGKAHFTVDGKDYVADKGDALLINPYEVHFSYALSKYLPMSFFCITFDLSLLSASPIHPAFSLCKKLSAGEIKFNTLIKNNKISSLILETEKIFTKKETAWEFSLTSCIFNIFALLIKNKEYKEISSPTKNHIFTAGIRKYIEENMTENITSSDAANYLSYDKSYFCRLFRKNFGQTFGEYLNFCRISLSREMLTKGARVSDAALSSGFNNLSYFTKTFKKYTGCLPSEYQNRTKC